jgi:hypothetical protein
MNFSTEPAQIVGYITSAATAVIALLVAFGMDITKEQTAAILGVVAVVAPIVAALVIRSKVYAPASVEKIAEEQYAAGVPPTEPQPDVPPPAAV